MTLSFRKITVALAFSVALALPAMPTIAQNLFEPVIIVNDQSITRYELQQRARMMQLFRAPGNPAELARTQLIEDRLKVDAARANGIILEDQDIQLGMEEFASRLNISAEQLIAQLESAGVSGSTFRDFVRAGLTWRELTRARFAPRVSVTEDDLERAKAAVSGSSSSVRVLLSEIIMPVPPGQAEAVQERAARISANTTTEAQFSAEARRYSASRTRGRGGRMEWMPLTNLPPQLRPIILGLAPGQVSDPLPLENAIALFQLRDIEEQDAPAPEYSAIEYAIYYLAGGSTEENLGRAQQIENDTDTCDDLYGIAQDQPPEVLERTSEAPADIPQDVAIVLARLDPGEIGTVTRSGGETLGVVMMCGRSPLLEGEGPTDQDLTAFITNSRLDSFASGYLEELRAEARIIEKE
ncbi:peptidylprolyl isomerase [Roseovarius sp. 2305UL8-3]|uniref:peptidylprolyl isomerase n=1 Tax=Roseovarius conchicola TaxID=3121636 RepID=UPI003528E191